MSFHLMPGGIVVGDGDRTVLNSDDGLLHTVPRPGWLSGEVAIPAIGRYSNSISDPPLDLTTSWNIGTCDPACNVVFGSIKFTLNNYAAGMAFDRWHTMFVGSVAVWVDEGEPDIDNLRGKRRGRGQFCCYRFECASGVVSLVRRIYLGPIAASFEVLSHTIDYKLRTGRFS